MPRRLPERCRPDCIEGFRNAAIQRHADALNLAQSERRTAAIYLWGYVVEMVMKASYFDLIGMDPKAPITRAELKDAYSVSVNLGWPHGTGRGYHNLEGWGNLLVLKRADLGRNYADPREAERVKNKSKQFQLLWRETLRYHDNKVYLFEVAQARALARWFLARTRTL